MAAGLTGGEFTSNWNDLSLGDLYERIRISMPQSASGQPQPCSRTPTSSRSSSGR